ncbi:centrosomal protein 43 isoform X3 [Carettochelys insculpta]|uniref:centrosomal protein 43 isoform X3 n=1 Tax=Carettochelys insculpta TaxID=44489 RepID=UPI003EBF54DE
MAAAEEDTELRDLLVQTLESSGVLNKIKAELRAAVFLALEEQEKVENKTPLVNESLKKFLSTKDGRLVAGLVAEFLQFFNLDFTLAVFQPESSTLNGLEGRENLAQGLGIIEAEGTVDGPLLLEVVRRCQQKKGSSNGEVAAVMSDMCSSPKSTNGQSGTHPSKVAETTQSDTSISSGETKNKSSIHFLPNETKIVSQSHNKDLNVKEKSDPAIDDDLEGDSFFDDPVPKLERNYGWKTESNKQGESPASLSEAPPVSSGLSSLAGAPSLKEPERTAEEDDYVDDFNSTSHRSEKSDISIGEEIEEISVEIEDLNVSDKLEDLTQDLTISQLKDVADYLEDVA